MKPFTDKASVLDWLNRTHYNAELHAGECTIVVGPRGGETLTQERWRANGQIKLWKTRPEDFCLPIKHGLTTYHYLEQNNCHLLHPADTCQPRRLKQEAKS